jgi:succinate dehydrogenase flavin-adding protein (antitoxin of CptAB toxin-antitoxin module)
MKTYASELEKFKKAEEDAKVKKMEEQGRYDEIIATKDSEINRLVKIEEKYNKWDSNKREKYLNMLPDEQKAKFQHLNTDDLENIAETFIKDESMAQVDSTRASARVNVVKPFSAKAKDKAEQKKSWADKIKSYR